MLTQKQKQTPYIYTFKLSSGEEIIATVVEEITDGFMIKHPLTLAMGQRGIQFAPFVILGNTEKPMKLNSSLILCSGEAIPEYESQYESITTGIALPQKSSIIT